MEQGHKEVASASGSLCSTWIHRAVLAADIDEVVEEFVQVAQPVSSPVFLEGWPISSSPGIVYKCT